MDNTLEYECIVCILVSTVHTTVLCIICIIIHYAFYSTRLASIRGKNSMY